MSRTEPHLVEREEQAYVGLRREVAADEFASVVDQGYPKLFGWLAEHGVELAAPPLIRYLELLEGSSGHAERFTVDLGAPIGAAVAVEGDEFVREVIPAGRYATLVHVGHFDGLLAATQRLEGWIHEQGLEMTPLPGRDDSTRAGHLEAYLVDPTDQPDPAKWETEIAILVTG